MGPDVGYCHHMNSMAIDVIQEYYNQNLFEPGKRWSAAEFDLRVYSRWIASEILNALNEDPMTPPLIIIVEFVHKMNEFCYMTENTEQSLMFTIAKDAAEDIARLFL